MNDPETNGCTAVLNRLPMPFSGAALDMREPCCYHDQAYGACDPWDGVSRRLADRQLWRDIRAEAARLQHPIDRWLGRRVADVRWLAVRLCGWNFVSFRADPATFDRKIRFAEQLRKCRRRYYWSRWT